MTVIAAVRGALPEHRYRQDELTEMFAGLLGEPRREAMLRRVHTSARVQTRHLALPIDRYKSLDGFGESNDEFVRHAVDLGAAAVRGALDDAGLEPRDVDLIVFTTVTGIAAPSIEARVAVRLGLRPDVKRIPMFGLGCVAGAAGVARLHDYLRGAPRDVAVLLAVELCSLTVQRNDASTANLVASGLFGDGAAAVVAVGDARSGTATGPVVVDSRSHLYPSTERTMGWDVSGDGLKIVLNAEVPVLVERFLGADVRAFLAAHDLRVEDITTWVSHPGGPKVIEAMQQVLTLPAEAFELTWRSLAEVGNLSSASVLHVLRDTMAASPPPGSPGLMLAMGPGFCSELVLLRWQ